MTPNTTNTHNNHLKIFGIHTIRLPRLLFSRSALLAQLKMWRSELPHVTPYYAVKSNNDPRLLRWLVEAGSPTFDCASPQELRDVQLAGATTPQTQTVYANPCKSPRDIQASQMLGARTTVVDSPEEVLKLRDCGWSGDLLIRLKVPDSGSVQPFSRKFGAPLEQVPEIIRAMYDARIPHAGWSFHVGSQCGDPKQFSEAILHCAVAEESARIRQGIRSVPMIVDIGGGFMPTPLFAQAAAEIRKAKSLFSEETRWIAEPGRFISTTVVSLEVEVIGVKRTSNNQYIYTLDESVYGAFSNIVMDGFKPTFELQQEHTPNKNKNRPLTQATVFGRTCDSADCLATNITLPKLLVGDTLRVSNMGAYTMVSASPFNGFPLTDRVYLE